MAGGDVVDRLGLRGEWKLEIVAGKGTLDGVHHRHSTHLATEHSARAPTLAMSADSKASARLAVEHTANTAHALCQGLRN